MNLQRSWSSDSSRESRAWQEPTPASRVQADLEERTQIILKDRAQRRQDHAFLQHFAHAAQESAWEREAYADRASQALGAQTAQQTLLEQALQSARADLANEQASFHASRDVQWKVDVRLAQYRRKAQQELADLGQRLAVEVQGYRQNAQQVASLAQALEVACRELQAESQVAQQRRWQADAAVLDVEEVRREAGAREALVTKVLHDTLARLEADFTRERAEHDAQEARSLRRSQDGTSAPSSPFSPSPAKELQVEGPRGPPTTILPAAVKAGIMSDLRRSLASAEANSEAAASASETTTAGLLKDIRRSLGLKKPEAAQAAPRAEVSSSIVEVTGNSSSAVAASSKAAPAVQPSLEKVMADLKRCRAELQSQAAALTDPGGSASSANAISSPLGTSAEPWASSMYVTKSENRASPEPWASSMYVTKSIPESPPWASQASASDSGMPGGAGRATPTRPRVSNGLLYV